MKVTAYEFIVNAVTGPISTVTAVQRGIRVWGSISYDNQSSQIHIDDSITTQRYVDDMLQLRALSFLRGISIAIYQHDNA
ncbi:hypothetical protein TNCV_554421 [Trichonephila clavipes]|nr:hypothetical protein TNCV_554421 [Trichonephila clavipes]